MRNVDRHPRFAGLRNGDLMRTPRPGLIREIIPTLIFANISFWAIFALMVL